MCKIDDNSKVTIAYTMCDKFGNLIEEVPKETPLVYLHGHENIIPGLEKKLTGHRQSETLRFPIVADDAYGPYQSELLVEVPKEDLEELGPLEPGMEIELYHKDLLEALGAEEEEEHFESPLSPEDLLTPEAEFPEEDDEPVVFIVKEIREDVVVLDGNHKLSGKDLVFTVEILQVEEATFEEIEQGYIDFYYSDPDEPLNYN
jgi:FKBP-type peptidyl-prolyl cis-trans isomerase SlyD